MLKKLTLLLSSIFLLLAVFNVSGTDISSSGIHDCADCKLTANITGTLIFTGTTPIIDMNGKTLNCGSSGNTVDNGITLPAGAKLTDSSGVGKITGCWNGVSIPNGADNVTISGINIDQTRYFGVHTKADNTKIIGGKIGAIAGVTNECYAIAAQFGDGSGGYVEGTYFYELYAQPSCTELFAGEGLPVNFSADHSGGVWKNSIALNREVKDHTYCAYLGPGGSHSVAGVTCVNFRQGIMGGADNSVDNNIIVLLDSITGNTGISLNSGAAPNKNVVIGYEMPFYADDDTNSVVCTGR